ncbi:hypothetical protein FBEOM_5925 [Fusarium beomiforme]|uniref:Uncharacterized protein n=1 Tax=Fusarium beomiforme TaxID=44412 RepID=A0A9P5DZK5_9HYPO|nr:hypothetical protein FBEOM_5925 [Fusarium beomiforme]
MSENQLPPSSSQRSVRPPVTPRNQLSKTEVGDGSQRRPVSLLELAPIAPRARGRPRGSKNRSKISKTTYRTPQTRLPDQEQALGDCNDSHRSRMDDDYIPDDDEDIPSQAAEHSQLGDKQVLVPHNSRESRAFAELHQTYCYSVHQLRQQNGQSIPVTKEAMEEREQADLLRLMEEKVWSQTKEDELSASWENGLIKAAIKRSPRGGSDLSATFIQDVSSSLQHGPFVSTLSVSRLRI